MTCQSLQRPLALLARTWCDAQPGQMRVALVHLPAKPGHTGAPAYQARAHWCTCLPSQGTLVHLPTKPGRTGAPAYQARAHWCTCLPSQGTLVHLPTKPGHTGAPAYQARALVHLPTKPGRTGAPACQARAHWCTCLPSQGTGAPAYQARALVHLPTKPGQLSWSLPGLQCLGSEHRYMYDWYE